LVQGHLRRKNFVCQRRTNLVRRNLADAWQGDGQEQDELQNGGQKSPGTARVHVEFHGGLLPLLATKVKNPRDLAWVAASRLW